MDRELGLGFLILDILKGEHWSLMLHTVGE